MNRQAVLAVGLAALLALAGCAGSTTPGAPAGSDGPASTDGGTATGTVQFYVSDQPAVIGDFEHLNVTITRVAFHRADGGAEDGETDADTATATNATNVTDATNATATDATVTGTDDRPETGTADEEDDDGTDDAEDAADTEDGGDGEQMGGAGTDERAGWETVAVDSRTVDLTRLRGDNATLVGTPSIPAGNYTKVAVFVASINATLTTGESVNVKLPSERLKLNKGFTLEPNGTVQFVYDISVVKAGNSGKYILKPVISQSGADQPVEAVDGEGEGDERPGNGQGGAAAADTDEDDTREANTGEATDDDVETDGPEATDAETDDADGPGGGGPPEDPGGED